MIKILKAVFNLLSNDTEIELLVDDKIFPDIVPDKDSTDVNIEYPLIVMRRSNISTEYTKCPDCKEDTATVEILCYSTQYFEAVDIAEEVRSTLEFYKGTVEGIDITKTRLVGVTEDYTDGAYYQLLTFTIK